MIFVTLFVIAIIILSFMPSILIGIWTYRDAKIRGLDAVLWTVIVILVPNLIGLVIYLLVGRKSQQIQCPNCNAKAEMGHNQCYNCGAVIPQEYKNYIQQKHQHSAKSLIAPLIIVFVLIITLVFGFTLFAVSSPEKFDNYYENRHSYSYKYKW